MGYSPAQEQQVQQTPRNNWRDRRDWREHREAKRAESMSVFGIKIPDGTFEVLGFLLVVIVIAAFRFESVRNGIITLLSGSKKDK